MQDPTALELVAAYTYVAAYFVVTTAFPLVFLYLRRPLLPLALYSMGAALYFPLSVALLGQLHFISLSIVTVVLLYRRRRHGGQRSLSAT